MSLPALQNDSNVPSSKLVSNGTTWWQDHTMAHVAGVSDGTGYGQWSYDSSGGHKIAYDSANQIWIDLADNQPSKVSDTYNVNTTAVTGSTTGANPAEVFLWNQNGAKFLGKFANPFYTASGSGGGPGTLADSDSDSDSDAPGAKRVSCNFW